MDFLDVTLDLERGIYKPYRKPGDKPLYVNAWSNHPPKIIKNIPLGINRRLCDISSNEEIFKEAVPQFQKELDSCGYKHNLVWLGEGEKPPKKKKNRRRPEIWFNPPYSQNVSSNVGKEFLKLVDKHFPKGSPLHKILNRNTVKVGYRCLPNMGRRIASHNAKIYNQANNPAPRIPASCNCQVSKKAECPIPGACNQDGAIYEAKVATNDGRVESYVGLAKNFKKKMA